MLKRWVRDLLSVEDKSRVVSSNSREKKGAIASRCDAHRGTTRVSQVSLDEDVLRD